MIHGDGRGKTIGVPTANLNVITQMIPLEGVYAAACTVNGHRYPVALSIGTTPTFEKHVDMQDLLTLDPIHDVDLAKGWPHT